MGYVMVVGRCTCCGETFGFNPHKVPSFEGEPICRFCISLVNEKRTANGLAPWPVYDDAYEAIPEGEL